MKISGFTVVKNAIKFHYPVVESINSILPICDEFIVNVGKSDDGTLELIKKMNSPKIRVIETDWDFSHGYTELATQTNLALAECRGDWAFYLQSDELIHEADLWKIKAWMRFYLKKDDVDALRFWWLHFYGSHYRYRIDQGWYQKQDRIIRNNGMMESYHDAFGFQRKDGKPLRRRNTFCYLYHYGWAYSPQQMAQRRINSGQNWAEAREKEIEKQQYDYGNLEVFPVYFGTHPVVMKKIIADNPLTKADAALIKKKYWWHPLRMFKIRYKTSRRVRSSVDPNALEKQKRILIIRVGNVGDVLMATGAFRKLKKAFPGCCIDVVTSPHSRDVVQGNKNIDNIFIYRKYKRIGGTIKKFFFERYLARNKYDLCLVLEQHPQYHQFARNIIGSRGLKIGFTSVPATNYLDHTSVYNYQEHAIENVLFLLRDYLKIPIDKDDCLMDFVIPGEAEQSLKMLLPKWKGSTGKYFVIHPGCSEYLPLRAWEMPNYVQVIRSLRAQGYRVFLTGAKSDKRFIDEIMKDYGHTDAGVEVFVDRPLLDVAFLIKHSSGMLSSDTGIMHLARAVRAPMVALFGPSDPHHTGCIGSGEYVQIRNDFKCGPCHYYPQYRYEDKKNCLHGQSPTCMKSISVEQVMDGVKKVLKNE